MGEPWHISGIPSRVLDRLGLGDDALQRRQGGFPEQVGHTHRTAATVPLDPGSPLRELVLVRGQGDADMHFVEGRHSSYLPVLVVTENELQAILHATNVRYHLASVKWGVNCLDDNGMREAVARWLAENVRKQKTTLDAVAEKAGVSRQTLSLIKAKKQWPKDDTLQRVANALGIDPPRFDQDDPITVISNATVATLKELQAIRELLEEMLDVTITQSARTADLPPEEALARADVARTVREAKRKRGIDNL